MTALPQAWRLEFTMISDEDMRNDANSLGTEILVRRKLKDSLFVYTSDQLQGLYVAHVDDKIAYNGLPKSIASLVKLDFGLECIVSHKTSSHCSKEHLL